MVEIVVYLVLLTLLTPPLGYFMYRVYQSEKVGRVEGVIYRIIGVDPMAEQTWRRYAACVLWFSLFCTLLDYVILRFQAHLPLNPLGPRRGERTGLVQHGDELHDEHELAGVRRRDHDELPDPDARPHVPELRVGGRGDGRADRADPRIHALEDEGARQLLARHGAHRRLHPHADRRRWSRSCSSRKGSRRPWARRRSPTASRASRRRSRADPSPRRSRSSSSARTAAVSST